MEIRKIGSRDGHYSFGRLRSRGKTKQVSEQVEDKLARVIEQGEILCESPTYSGLKTYREVLREVVGLYISRKYLQSERAEWQSFGKLGIYATLRRLDQVLSELADDIRTGKVSQSRIAARQDKIHALLEDVLR